MRPGVCLCGGYKRVNVYERCYEILLSSKQSYPPPKQVSDKAMLQCHQYYVMAKNDRSGQGWKGTYDFDRATYRDRCPNMVAL